MKNRKAPGINVITAEVLKAGGDPMVAMLHKIFNTVYDTEKTPTDLARMMVTTIHKRKATSKHPRTIAQFHYPPSLAKYLVEYSSAEFRNKNRRGYRRESVRLQTRPWNGRCHLYRSTNNRKGKRTPSATSFQLYRFQSCLRHHMQESAMKNAPSHRRRPQDSPNSRRTI